MNSLGAAAEQFEAAVNALYNNPEPSVKSEANAWLTSFSASPAAWPVSTQVLSGPSSTDEIKFFCANLLLSKVHSDWSSCPADLRSQLPNHLFCLFLGYLCGSASASHLVISRLCRVVAALAVKPTAEVSPANYISVESLLDVSIQQASSLPNQWTGPSTQVLCSLIQAVGEEASEADRLTQTRILPQMRLRFNKVGSFLTQLVLHSSDHNSNGTVASLTFNTLLPWLRIDFSTASQPGITASTLLRDHSALWTATLHALLYPSQSVREPAVECLVLLVGSFDSPGEHGPETEAAIYSAVVHALAEAYRQKDKVEIGEGNVGSLLRGISRVAVALAERSPELIAGPKSGAVGQGLVELVLEVANTPTEVGELEAVCDSAVDFFTALGIVPMMERREQLRGQSQMQLVQCLLRKASFPHDIPPETDDWVDWWDSESDAFQRFRDYVVTEGLLICLPVLQGHFYVFLQEAYQASSSWQQAEVIMFALKFVGQMVKRKVVNPSNAASFFQEPANVQLVSCLGHVFQDVFHQGETGTRRFTSPPAGHASFLHSPHSILTKSTVEALGAFADWFQLRPELLSGALKFILAGFQVPGATSASAEAFRSICSSCTSHISNPDAIQGLIAAAEEAALGNTAASALTGLSQPAWATVSAVEALKSVMDGLARLVSSIQQQEMAAATVQRLLGPQLTLASELALLAPPSDKHGREQHAAALACRLQLASAALHRLEFDETSYANGANHPCSDIMLPTLDLLSSILALPYWRSCEPVAAAACGLHSALLLNLKASFLPAAEPVLALHLTVFQETLLPACLKFLGSTIEVSSAHLRSPNPPISLEVLASAVHTVSATLQAADMSRLLESMTAYFEFLNRCLVFSPLLVASSGVLASSLALATTGLSQSDKDLSRAVLTFLSHVVAPGLKAALSNDWQRLHQQLSEALLEQQLGGRVVESILLSVAGSLPRDLIRTAANILREVILMASNTYAPAWLASSLQHPKFLEAAGGRVGDPELRLFVSAALAKPPLPKQLFGALLSDFALVCRAESTSDQLLAYEVQVAGLQQVKHHGLK